MNTIQTDVSDEALVTAIRANMCDFFRHLSRSDPAEHFENVQFARWYTPLPHLGSNGVLCSDSHNEGDESFIDETIRYFREKGVKTFTWWMEPHLKPSDWESALARHGFGFSNDTPGVAIGLPIRNYLGYLNGKPVSTSTVF